MIRHGEGSRVRCWLGVVAVTWIACVTVPSPTPLGGALLADLQTDAERARELRFPGPVDAWQVSPGHVRELLAEELSHSLPADEARTRGRALAMLGLVPADTDLLTALLDFQSDAVVGFYTPLRRRLYLVGEGRVGGGLAPSARSLAVHELVHALQDLHTGLLDVLLGVSDHDDLSFAIGGLLEGDATWASFRHEERTEGTPPLTAAALAADYSAAWAEAVYPRTPRFIRDNFVLLYPTGYAVVEQLVAAGGVAALDAALVDPPLSSEELLHPERYVDPHQRRGLAWFAIDAAGLAAGCRSLGQNTFGEIGLRVWAQERGAAADEAADFADGWDGDRALAFECPGGSAMAWLIQLDDETIAARFEQAARPYVAALGADGALTVPARVDRWNERVLISSGIEAHLRWQLLDTKPLRFADLGEYLAARPAIRELARELRERGAATP